MGAGVLKAAFELARRLARGRGERDATDRQLLQRFVDGGDQCAFAALVERHGPMVLGLCRRLLHNVHDADDTFQAVFLVLVKKARSIARPELLGNWLYGVAYRTAVKARIRSARLRTRENRAMPAPAIHTEPAADWADLRPILDEEISRLPDRYRAALVLCYLQGKSNEEAARLLGCPIGTVQSRLARARQRLRLRLERRGVALTAGFLAAGAALPEAAASVPAVLAMSTVQDALLLVSGNAASLPPQVNLLMQGVVRAMFLTRLLHSACLVMLLACFGGAALFSYHALAGGPAGPIAALPAERLPADDPNADDPQRADDPKSAPPKPVDWAAPRTWTSLPADADRTAPILRDLVAIKDQLFAVGDKGTFYQYRDGKVTRIACPTEQQLRIAWGRTPDAVYAAGDKGVVVRFDGKTLQVVGQPLATHKQTHHPSIKPYDSPVRLDAVWASSPRDIYAAGPAILIHYDGKRWHEVDVGAGQVIVPSTSRLTRAVVTPLVGPIWGTGPADVWVRKARVDPGDGPRIQATRTPVVMHFDGKAWSQTTLTMPEDPSARDVQGTYVPKLSFTEAGIWTRIDTSLERWHKDHWQPVIRLPGNLCTCWTIAAAQTAFTSNSGGGKYELNVFAKNRWQPIAGPPMIQRGAPRKLAVTEDGAIGCLFYGDEGIWKGASVARIHVGTPGGTP